MIAFKDSFNKNNKLNLSHEYVQDLIDAIYGTEEYRSVNIQKILDIIYKKMYKENKEAIQIMILKNPNNSLDVVIDNFET